LIDGRGGRRRIRGRLIDDGDPFNWIIIVLAVSHGPGLVTVLEILKNVLRTMNEYEETILFQPTWIPDLDSSISTTSNRPRMRLRTPRQSMKGCHHFFQMMMMMMIIIIIWNESSILALDRTDCTVLRLRHPASTWTDLIDGISSQTSSGTQLHAH